MDHDVPMGSNSNKSRKAKRTLPKVPKYEEPNTAVGFDGGSSFGRSGHGTDHHRSDRPGRVGSFFLKILGQGQKE
jgi:hypothetical protein